jgi:hypothetical protein
VAAFPFDNNGTIIELPSVPASGSPSVPGVLVFGIGTQSNNGLGSATVFDLDEKGFVSTIFPGNGSAVFASHFNSGSNGIFFLDSVTTALPQCSGKLGSYYCPSAMANLSAVILATNGARTTVAFNVANVSRISSGTYATSNLAGPMPGFPTDTSAPGFDWGLPFYFGRSVYTAIEGTMTPAGPGPYVAF